MCWSGFSTGRTSCPSGVNKVFIWIGLESKLLSQLQQLLVTVLKSSCKRYTGYCRSTIALPFEQAGATTMFLCWGGGSQVCVTGVVGQCWCPPICRTAITFLGLMCSAQMRLYTGYCRLAITRQA
jgi:hypothetical protein